MVDEDTFLNKEKPSAPPPPPPPPSKKETRSSITKQVERLEKLSLKEWNKLVRNKQFNWDDGIRTKIIKMRSQGKKFEDWVVETKDIDDGDLGEIEPSVITSAMAAAIAACTAKDAVLLPLGCSSSNVF